MERKGNNRIIFTDTVNSKKKVDNDRIASDRGERENKMNSLKKKQLAQPKQKKLGGSYG